MDIQNTLEQLIGKELTQMHIASELQCSQSTVSDMLRGKTGKTRPSFAMVTALTALAKKHGLSVKRLSKTESA